MTTLPVIDQSWTLYLDRDGVINHEKKEDYIRNSSEFVFYDDSLEALAILAAQFSRIIIVTNQKGIGKGLMTTDDLTDIHTGMTETITASGGRIDRIYYCADLADDSPNRKPQHGMALQAQADYPEIIPAKTIMVGNRLSDMQFGRNAGAFTVYLATTHPETPDPHPLIDARFNNLLDFAKAVTASPAG
ncbi:D-glycero-alpha-D-manno-heptose-1,7-bisphosphate 7-phosphatase [Sediminibacterium ginsengisoli]|uniref:D,D-heptose 1,7-bisphosphate phosphatase n=1 Tax=Sediminibacterium ginsengisoli TaxID=413434 RepID=A0A1T4PQ34_9BACT|nr:HAD-IIIA family hydrolase [Sediminibacterium ginsengisoli]SJZ93421.1 D-glycero-D-manno-heptose 1,7-bisphosphate phosphatase [Sediminibacterium ginsengisoli]